MGYETVKKNTLEEPKRTSTPENFKQELHSFPKKQFYLLLTG